VFDEGARRLQPTFVLVPVAGPYILDKVDSGRGHAWVEVAEGREHVAHHVAAVIEHNVYLGMLRDYAVQQRRVVLATDVNLYTFGLMCLAGRVYVGADDP
jgi:hypothetical protein